MAKHTQASPSCGEPVYKGFTSQQLDKAFNAASVVLVVAITSVALNIFLLLLLGESFYSSKIASRQISIIRQHLSEAGILEQSGGNESFNVSSGDERNGFSAPIDAITLRGPIEHTNAAPSDLEQCRYCDMRNAMPVTRSDCLKALYDAFVCLETLPVAQFAPCRHGSGSNEERRPDRSGMHWSGAVSAFYLRRDLEERQAKHQSAVNATQQPEEHSSPENKDL